MVGYQLFKGSRAMGIVSEDQGEAKRVVKILNHCFPEDKWSTFRVLYCNDGNLTAVKLSNFFSLSFLP